MVRVSCPVIEITYDINKIFVRSVHLQDYRIRIYVVHTILHSSWRIDHLHWAVHGVLNGVAVLCNAIISNYNELV